MAQRPVKSSRSSILKLAADVLKSPEARVFNLFLRRPKNFMTSFDISHRADVPLRSVQDQLKHFRLRGLVEGEWGGYFAPAFYRLRSPAALSDAATGSQTAPSDPTAHQFKPVSDDDFDIYGDLPPDHEEAVSLLELALQPAGGV